MEKGHSNNRASINNINVEVYSRNSKWAGVRVMSYVTLIPKDVII